MYFVCVFVNSHDEVQHEIDGRVEYNQHVRQVFDDGEPTGPLAVTPIDDLVEGWDEFPKVTAQVQANDAERYAGEAGLLSVPGKASAHCPSEPA